MLLYPTRFFSDWPFTTQPRPMPEVNACYTECLAKAGFFWQLTFAVKSHETNVFPCLFSFPSKSCLFWHQWSLFLYQVRLLPSFWPLIPNFSMTNATLASFVTSPYMYGHTWNIILRSCYYGHHSHLWSPTCCFLFDPFLLLSVIV